MHSDAENTVNVIAISYAKGLLERGSREHERAKEYAACLGAYHVIVFTRAREGFSEVVSDGNLTIHPTDSKSRASMLLDAYRIGKKILKKNADTNYIVSSQDPFEASIVGLLLARAKNATHHVQLHECAYCGDAWRRESFVNRVRWWFGRFVVRRAHCIRVVSERIKRSLLALGVPEARITVLPIYSELDEYVRIKRSYEDRGHVTILAAGRLARVKNFGLIIHALKTLALKYPSVKLRIVGSGPEEAKLKALIRSLGLEESVIFIPKVPSLTEEMENADIFALSSNHEGYGLVLVEAMASGLPLVVTDVGCVGEVVQHDEHGLVVPVGDTEAFARALEKLIQDKDARVRFGENGQKTAREISIRAKDAYISAWVESLCCYNTVNGS